jgi:hypothetical protein
MGENPSGFQVEKMWKEKTLKEFIIYKKALYLHKIT